MIQSRCLTLAANEVTHIHLHLDTNTVTSMALKLADGTLQSPITSLSVACGEDPKGRPSLIVTASEAVENAELTITEGYAVWPDAPKKTAG